MDIESTIKRMLIADLFVDVPEESMGLDDSLREVMGLDSLGFMELRVQCEDTFGVQISDEDFSPEHFASIRTVTALVGQLRKANGAVTS